MARPRDSSYCKPCHRALGLFWEGILQSEPHELHPVSARASGNRTMGTLIFLLRGLKILDLVLEFIKASALYLVAFKINRNISGWFRM
jgi:hypothetical protein